MWKSRTKIDLMIEVWEKLDCESVGAKELIAIEKAVREQYGDNAVETPMRTARILADEGAELRHAEILELDVKRRLETPYAPLFRNILKFTDFRRTIVSIRQLENLRQKFMAENDKEGLRLVRESGIKGKNRARMISKNPKVDKYKRAEKAEIAEWFTIWLQNPEVFETWVTLRQNSKDFKERFKEESDNPKSEIRNPKSK